MRCCPGIRVFGVVVGVWFSGDVFAQDKPGPAIVTGALHAVVGTRAIAVPDLTLQLRDPTSGVVRATTRSDLTGHFHFSRQPPARYQVCWAGSGFVTACSGAFSLQGKTAYVGDFVVTPRAPFVFGRIRLKDQSPCYGVDPGHGVNLFTRVTAQSAAGSTLVPPVRANSQGDYLIAALPQVSGPRVRAVCEGLSETRSFQLGGGAVDIGFSNQAPKIDDVNAFIAGEGRTHFAVSSVVDVRAQARDPDDDVLHYRWRIEGTLGSIDALDAANTKWRLPAKPGVYTAHVLVFDGKGGYAASRVTVTVGGNGAFFSGRVVDGFTNSPIKGARVSVVGKSTLTDVRGQFYLAKVPYVKRYVLGITRDGFAPLSRIYDESSTGAVYRMETAQQTLDDPRATIDVTDRRRELERRQKRGVRLIMDPGTLTTTNPVITSLSTMDPSYRAMPGDYRATDRSGNPQSLVSFGAVFASFQDSVTGAVVRIAPGRKATVEFPVAPGQVAVAKPTIALWSYDETKGIWFEEGAATLQNRGGGNWVYVGTTTHFSYINTDVAQGGDATCLRVRVDPLLVPSGLTLRVHIPTAPSYKQLQETSVDGDQFHALYRLPKTETVTLELIDAFGNVIPGTTQNIDLNTRPPMLGTNLWPPYPYTECGAPVLMGITMPAYGELSQGKPYFLTGPYGAITSPAGYTPKDVTTAYYKGIGALDASGITGPKDTLGKWWGLNGFDANTGAGGTRAAYINHNDLGFGRDMHCTQSGGNAACYVTNYGFPDQNPGNADQALEADPTKAIATVAMEYSPLPSGGAPVVKFYAYLHGDKDGPIIFDAALDAFGPKPIPYLCVVCHGGEYYPVDPLAPDATELAMGSKFREFDLESFRFPPGGAVYPPTVPTGQGSLADFRTLNDLVRTTLPSDSAIRELIDGWYPGASTTPLFSATPSGWSSAGVSDLYHQVYGKACRTCHAAREGLFEFKTFDDFRTLRGAIKGAVCDDTKTMPNAVVTYRNFWQSVPSQPAFLGSFSTSGWAAFGSCD